MPKKEWKFSSQALLSAAAQAVEDRKPVLEALSANGEMQAPKKNALLLARIPGQKPAEYPNRPWNLVTQWEVTEEEATKLMKEYEGTLEFKVVLL